MFSLRLRLIGLFVVMALAVSAVIVFAVERFSSEALMNLMMEGSDSPEEAQLMFDQYVGRVLLIGAGVAVVLGSLAAWWLLRRILRPLDQLAEATRAIAAGDLATRVPQPPDPELRLLADGFNRMTASLQQGEALRRALVEDLAHELRTPLTTLRGYTEALADGVVEPTPEMLRTVHEEIERLTRLIESLDLLSRGADVRRPEARSAVDLAALVSRALDLASHDLGRRRIATRLLTDDGLPRVHADGDAIGQVVANLVQNAGRYTDDGGSVEVRLEAADDHVRCSVENSGVGIPAGELPLIWERLHRVDPSRARTSGGAGIGLAIVREIVEAHDGRVGATSSDGHTRVWFSLPQRPSGESQP